MVSNLTAKMVKLTIIQEGSLWIISHGFEFQTYLLWNCELVSITDINQQHLGNICNDNLKVLSKVLMVTNVWTMTKVAQLSTGKRLMSMVLDNRNTCHSTMDFGMIPRYKLLTYITFGLGNI